jgi:brefeldin A-inhibited guanine nucleotide-exchange protein
MKDEKPDASKTGSNGSIKKEYDQFKLASESMTSKTEALFNDILKSNSRTSTSSSGSGNDMTLSANSNAPLAVFYSATHYEHVKPMFELIWMAVLTAISGPLQQSEDPETIIIALEGFKYAITISCIFDMELERKAFMSTLTKFTQINNAIDMKFKTLEAIKALLEVACTNGNKLADSWMDVVVSMSQLERVQSFRGDSGQEDAMNSIRRDSMQNSKRDLTQSGSTNRRVFKGVNQEFAAAASSQSMTILIDRVFTASARFSGDAIIKFVKALCIVSWTEISSTSNSEHPFMFCLQRLVEISYYNMKRIRVEWANIWSILGPHFNQVASHSNPQVCLFALDKLRQLAVKFLEIEELSSFKFQKDFLRPFEHVLVNTTDLKIHDMALTCLSQMIQAKHKSIKSGWKTIFSAVMKAANAADGNEIIVVSL